MAQPALWSVHQRQTMPWNAQEQEILMPEGMDIDIGISGDQRKAIADGLSRLLADTYTVYLKTHNF
ncbi:MAG: hypothetical protein RLN80_00660, partial [Rhodospirillales bacterium]